MMSIVHVHPHHPRPYGPSILAPIISIFMRAKAIQDPLIRELWTNMQINKHLLDVGWKCPKKLIGNDQSTPLTCETVPTTNT
jgi:hypothetical protein